MLEEWSKTKRAPKHARLDARKGIQIGLSPDIEHKKRRQTLLNTYTYPEFPYLQSAEQRSGKPARHPVVIVGAGPIGLTAALECAQRGIKAVGH